VSRTPRLLPRVVGRRAACLLVAAGLAGCAGTRLPWQPAAAPAPAGKPAGGVFYATADDVAVRSEPSRTADVVVLLRRDQAVVRRRALNGWAWVEVRGTRSAGWVDAGLLTSRRPQTAGAGRPPAGEAATAATEPAPEAGTPPTEPTTGYPPPAPDDAARPAPSARPTPSIFDPF
jgi:hypothetical protein